MMDLQSVVVAAHDQVSTALENEVVILNLKSGIYYGLNAVGARVWELIKQPTAAGQVIETIQAEYNVEAQRCQADIMGILENLSQAGLVEVVGEPAG